MDTTTGLKTERTPQGWPPEQPVELVRVKPLLLWTGTCALVLLVGLSAVIAWQLCAMQRADETRRVDMMNVLSRIADKR